MQVGRFKHRQWSRRLLILFYLFAGLNHFLNPDFYLPLIPDYIPAKSFINLLSGALEMALAIGVLFPFTRKNASTGLIILLLAFIPSHVYFIEIGACVPDSLCTPVWAAWLRLLVVHPFLIWWAWGIR